MEIIIGVFFAILGSWAIYQFQTKERIEEIEKELNKFKDKKYLKIRVEQITLENYSVIDTTIDLTIEGKILNPELFKTFKFPCGIYYLVSKEEKEECE